MGGVNLYDVVEISYRRIVPTSGFWGFSIISNRFPINPMFLQKFCLSSLWQLAAHHLLCDDAVATSEIHARNLPNSDEMHERKAS